MSRRPVVNCASEASAHGKDVLRGKRSRVPQGHGQPRDIASFFQDKGTPPVREGVTAIPQGAAAAALLNGRRRPGPLAENVFLNLAG